MPDFDPHPLSKHESLIYDALMSGLTARETTNKLNLRDTKAVFSAVSKIRDKGWKVKIKREV